MNKELDYPVLLKQVEAIAVDTISNAGNLCNMLSLLRNEMNLFWCGLYLRHGHRLGLGPFQGSPACTNIEFGRGVCGTAAAQGKSVIVPDVSKFPGYIACHADTKSEIVIPGFKNGKVAFVLDIDSTELDYFTEEDKHFFEDVTKLMSQYI